MSRLSRVIGIATLLPFLVVAIGVGVALADSYQWVRQFGALTDGDPTYPHDKTYEVSANETGVYLTGYTDGLFSGETGSGGSHDNFLIKYDCNGGHCWTRQFGTPGMDYAMGVCADGQDVYVVGYVPYGESYPGQTPIGGSADNFLRKFDADGNSAWTRHLGTTSSAEYALGVAAHSSGIYVAGQTKGSFPYDPNPKPGSYDIYVIKFDGDGDTLWARLFGTTTDDKLDNWYGGSQVIYVDDSGVYVAGYTQVSSSPYWQDIIVAKYDHDGEKVWQSQFGTENLPGTSNSERPSWICVHEGFVYVAGYTTGAFKTEYTAGTQVGFICKLDALGDMVVDDTYPFQISDEEGRNAIVGLAIYADRIVVAGWVEVWLGGYNYDQNIFVREYDLNLQQQWTETLNSAGDPYGTQDICSGVATYGGDFYVGGTTIGTMPGQSSAGYYDGFVAKWAFNSPPTVYIEYEEYTVDEGTPVEILAIGEDPDGDDLVYNWDLDNDGEYEVTDQNPVEFLESAEGIYPISVEVTDGSASATDEATVEVLNVAPEVVGGIQDAPIDPVAAPALVQVWADFTDPGTGETYTATWYWGDGTYSAGEFGNSVTGEHVYTEAGVYTITLVLSDGVDECESIYQYVVVYDPSAGFVTGGGWIDSPEGAYRDNPELYGKANFGFVSKYKKGATVPTGNTQFCFDLADMDFHSTEYEWLVIAGEKAMFKGSGVINDEGDYGFMLTAKDGDGQASGIDGFRIKIWDKEAGDRIVYDNCTEDLGECEPQALGGGNIMIHTGGGGKQSMRAGRGTPTVFALNQNQPNPFYKSTTIQYSLPSDRNVSLKIYDSAGRMVKTLVDEHQAPGYHTADWDGTNCSGARVTSGIYLARLIAGDFTSTRKMVLAR